MGPRPVLRPLRARGSPAAAVSVAELFTGARGKKEETALETFLGAFEIVPVDAAAAREAGRVHLRFGPSHGTGLADVSNCRMGP